MKPANLAYVYVGLAVLFWGSSAAVAKLLLAELSNVQVFFYTSIIATITLFLLVVVQGKLAVLKQYRLRDYFTLAYTGFIGIFLYYILLFGALTYLPAQIAFIINYLWPVLFVIFSIALLNERGTLRTFFGLLLSFVGVVVVLSKGSLGAFRLEAPAGILLALGAAIAGGLFFALDKKHNYERFTSTMLYFFFSSIYATITILTVSTIPTINAQQLVGLGWFGVFVSGLAFTFWFLALKHGDTAKMSNIIFLTPFVSLLFIYFLLNEKILLTSFFGLALIIAGIIVQNRKKR